VSRFVVVGSGRCGTGWAAELLRQCGVNCGHERVFRWGTVLRGEPIDWGDWQADAAWTAVPRLAELGLPAVLLTRHPLDVVRSMLALGWLTAAPTGADLPRLAQIVSNFRPEIDTEPTQADRCLAMWWHWNIAALPHVGAVVRLEDAVRDPLLLLQAVGVHPERLPSVPRWNGKDDKKRPTPHPRWEQFRPELAREARHLAARFGYEETL